MSAEDRAPGTSVVPAASYEVGYGKPPVARRFQKGRSGNPQGRPRGARNQPRPFDPADKPTDGLILEEAYRRVTIREGDKAIELPAIQAAMRALTISAMKGSRLSQKALAEIVREVEGRRSAEHITMLENAFEYKQRWTEELNRRRTYNIEAPDPIPHPDDIIIDVRSGKVRTEGPLDAREKARWDESIARRSEAQAEVNEYAERYRKARSPKAKAMWLSEWHYEQRMFDIVNDVLPQRYKVRLENRSYAEGASREGKALDELRKNRAMRAEYIEAP